MSTRDLCLRQLTDIVIAMCRMLVCGEAGGGQKNFIPYQISHVIICFLAPQVGQQWLGQSEARACKI